ncbi:rhodanese-like domain-containing protein 4, chloroplastic [Magnolia sinica]|uniref:rhodanese-like domain-containing protein 4, chloroplastic n=1 Tax=Magnolia sinica TaxID=86752 RepID=UPI00265AB5EC|nr:rhodanese-like domain-containing protein 4, chloroplastic [Magnolia sinica]
MEVLNLASLTPVSVHKPSTFSDRRTEHRKLLSLPPSSPLKFSKPATLSSSLALLSSVLSRSGSAGALTYEEALKQSLSSFTPGGSVDFDLGGLIDSFLKFATDNPPIVIGSIAVLAVPLVLSQVLKKPKSYGIESARNAYSKLSEDGGALLLDIRSAKDIRGVGSPDLRSLKKKAVLIEYRGDDKPVFLKKLSLKFKEPENTTMFILDKFDGNSELVAELVTINGFKATFAIKDGAEGPRGWINSGLPWLQPKKAPSIDFGDLKDLISGALIFGADGLSLTLGLAAATGLGLLAFTEVETVLQVLGSVALVQFATKKLLFAEDRKQTVQQVDEFLTTKVAPGELLDEIKMIGKALLPAPLKQKALPPAPAEASPSTEVPEVKPEAATKPPQINSMPKEEVKADTISGLQRPLSPYPYYPDFKPPTSPSPSQP